MFEQIPAGRNQKLLRNHHIQPPFLRLLRQVAQGFEKNQSHKRLELRVQRKHRESGLTLVGKSQKQLPHRQSRLQTLQQPCIHRQ